MWVGIDGEGVGRNPHRYIMLGYSDGYGKYVDVIERKSGLKTKECLDFLLSTPSDARLCGYYLGYDWTKILHELPNASIYKLLRPELRLRPRDEGSGFCYVYWRDYGLHYLAGMMRIRYKQKKVTIWDLGKFFQCSFVEALKKWEIINKNALDAMFLMKLRRSMFDDSDKKSIEDYMLSECSALARLAENLDEAHEQVGLKLASWHGPGSTASVLLKSMRIDELKGSIPPSVEYVADYAFFGGRFEQSGIGLYGDITGSDIVSAYPYEAYNLPCLIHGQWKHITSEKNLAGCRQACVHYKITDIGNEPWGPLPCRLKNGSIVFPQRGVSGYVWLKEYSRARCFWKGVKFIEAWALYNECDCQPFKDIINLFRERIRLGKSGRGIVTKNAINSIYGKLAQTIGLPKYASRIWAGMITSGTRARLLEFIALHKNRSNVIALATDGTYSKEKVNLPTNPLPSDTLGGWESKYYGEMCFVRPGIYWSSNGLVRSRGISKKQFSDQQTAVLEAIDCEDSHAQIGESTLFGGARACVYKLPSGEFKRSQFYGEWHNIPAKISLTPAPKRREDWGLHLLDNIESQPYTKTPLSDDAKTLEKLSDIFWGLR